MFPARPRICLDCRLALCDGESCTWLTHEVVDLAGDCRPLIARVWRRDRPLGAATEPMVPLNAVGVRGRIDPGPTTPAPLGAGPAVGFALEVRHAEAAGSPVMLRDGASVGFTVAGEDGRVLLVPAGGLRIGPRGLRRLVRTRRHLDAYLRAVAPDAGRPSPFPCDEAHLAVLVPGDVVTVRAIASVRPDPRGTTAYREAPRSILVASGPAWVEPHA
jgi:hypothetical protein